MKSPVIKSSMGNKNILTRTWNRCGSIFNTGTRKVAPEGHTGTKKVTPEGFFPVYVGPEKQWFAVKTKYANHPLFQILLEEAELKYGYNTTGPIQLPCEVDVFYKVVAEMEAKEMQPHGCGFGPGLIISTFNPSRKFMKTCGDQVGKGGYGGYGVLTSSRLIN